MKTEKVVGSERGSVLFVSMLVMLMLTGLASIFVQLTTSRARDADSRLEHTRAAYVAEAGLEDAIAEASVEGGDLDGEAFVAGSVFGGSYQVELTWLDTEIMRFVSTGRVGKAQRRMEAIIRITTDHMPPCLAYGVLTEGDLDLRGSIWVKGNVHTNQGLQFAGATEKVTEDASACADVTGEHATNVGGDTTPGAARVDIPLLDLDALKAAAQDNGTYYTSSVEFFAAQGSNEIRFAGDGDVLFIDGDLQWPTGGSPDTRNVSVYGKGLLVASGEVGWGGNVQFVVSGSETEMIVVAGTTIRMRGNSTIEALLYAADGVATLGGTPEVTGGVIAAQAAGSIRGNVDIFYKPLSDDLWNWFPPPPKVELLVKRNL